MPSPKDPIKRAEWIRNLSISHEGKSSGRKGKTGCIPWNKGIPCATETRVKIGDANRIKRLGTHHSLETCEKISASLSNENNPMWKGGVSFEPYCSKFNEKFKERVRAFFGYKCMFPGCDHVWQPGEKKLAVHHVNYDKTSCCSDAIPLFVPVCPGSCHAKTNHNRGYYEKVFTDMIMNEYNGECYLRVSNADQAVAGRNVGEPDFEKDNRSGRRGETTPINTQ